MPYPPADIWREQVRAFREELRKRGWASSVNVEFDERWTGDNMDLVRSAATNLVELNPDAILAVGGRVIPILMGLTRSIPIVNPGGSDPVANGYAQSLAHPGGNVTGFAIMELSVISKMLQTLKEDAPAQRRHARRLVRFHDFQAWQCRAVLVCPIVRIRRGAAPHQSHHPSDSRACGYRARRGHGGSRAKWRHFCRPGRGPLRLQRA